MGCGQSANPNVVVAVATPVKVGRRPSLDLALEPSNLNEMQALMKEILAHPEDRADFSEFMGAEFATESLDFLTKLDSFEKGAPPTKEALESDKTLLAERTALANAIFVEHLQQNSPALVNISSQTLKAVAAAMAIGGAGAAVPAVFEQAKDDTLKLIARDKLKRFVEKQRKKHGVAPGT